MAYLFPWYMYPVVFIVIITFLPWLVRTLSEKVIREKSPVYMKVGIFVFCAIFGLFFIFAPNIKTTDSFNSFGSNTFNFFPNFVEMNCKRDVFFPTYRR